MAYQTAVCRGPLKISKMGPSIQLSLSLFRRGFAFPSHPSTLCLYISVTTYVDRSLNLSDTDYAPGPGKDF